MVLPCEMALIARRYDTLMSRAMLRALGEPPPHRLRRAPRAQRRPVRDARFDGIEECFRNPTSPMDWASA